MALNLDASMCVALTSGLTYYQLEQSFGLFRIRAPLTRSLCSVGNKHCDI